MKSRTTSGPRRGIMLQRSGRLGHGLGSHLTYASPTPHVTDVDGLHADTVQLRCGHHEAAPHCYGPVGSRLASPSTHRFSMASMYIRTPGELRMVLSSTWLSITFTPELESPLLLARPLHLNVTTTLEGVVLTSMTRRCRF